MGLTDADYEGIRQLFARYSQTLDFGDARGFAACFAEGGSLDTSSPEEGLSGEHRGHEELRAFATSALEYSAGYVRHVALNTLIEGDGTSARATSFAIVTRAYADAPSAWSGHDTHTYSTLDTTGMFFDELVKVEEGWLFSRREFRHDGLPDVLERARQPITIGPKPKAIA